MKNYSRNKNNLLVLAFVVFGTMGILSLFMHLDGSMGGFWFYVMIASFLLATVALALTVSMVAESEAKISDILPLRALTEGAVFVAAAQVLGYLKLYELPQGGSIVIAMFPIFFYCVRWGFLPGMLASAVYSVLQLTLDGAYAWGWQSIIGDYLLAFTVLGVAGAFHRKKYGIFWGTIVGSMARFLVHYVTGATVWAEYMPEEFFGMTMTSPWIYSALYNGSYMIPNMILCLILAALVFKPLGKYIRGEDLKRQ